MRRTTIAALAAGGALVLGVVAYSAVPSGVAIAGVQAAGAPTQSPTAGPPTTYPTAPAKPGPLISCTYGDTCAVGGNNGTGTAMNNWFGNGPLYQYTQGKSNEEFTYQLINRCLGGDQVTAACPFANSSFDNALKGKYIIQIPWAVGTQSDCVGVPSNTEEYDAYANIKCNTVSGTGGGLYTVFVVAGNGSFVSVGCTNNDNEWCQLEAATSGNQDTFQQQGSGATEWSPVP